MQMQNQKHAFTMMLFIKLKKYFVFFTNINFKVLKKGKNLKAFFRLGDCYFNMKDYKKAIKNFKKALKLDPE